MHYPKVIPAQAPTPSPRYTVMIPTWNNLEFIQCCLESLRRNCSLPYQAVVFVNEGNDGTREWLAQQDDVDVLLSDTNVGICYALNWCRVLAKAPYLVYLNDDMYVLPDWDKALLGVAEALPHKNFMLSGTMIEPYQTNNPCVSYGDYGQNLTSFQEEHLLATYTQHQKADWSGSTWPPNLLPIELWDAVGGMSIEFSPGSYSDPDLSRKCWEFGVRHFQGVGKSLVYHFGRQSTSRLKGHRGREIFLGKWGHSAGSFTTHYLGLGKPHQGVLPEGEIPLTRKLKDWLKRKGIVKV